VQSQSGLGAQARRHRFCSPDWWLNGLASGHPRLDPSLIRNIIPSYTEPPSVSDFKSWMSIWRSEEHWPRCTRWSPSSGRAESPRLSSRAAFSLCELAGGQRLCGLSAQNRTISGIEVAGLRCCAPTSRSISWTCSGMCVRWSMEVPANARIYAGCPCLHTSLSPKLSRCSKVLLVEVSNSCRESLIPHLND
jgi:hypothetical protein